MLTHSLARCKQRARWILAPRILAQSAKTNQWRLKVPLEREADDDGVPRPGWRLAVLFSDM